MKLWDMDESDLVDAVDKFVGQSPAFWQDTNEYWLMMSIGNNPLYRLLALEYAAHFAKDSRELLGIYERALDEANTIFQYKALNGLRNMAPRDACPLIKRFLQKKNVASNDGTLQLLEQKGGGDVLAFARETLKIVELKSGGHVTSTCPHSRSEQAFPLLHLDFESAQPNWKDKLCTLYKYGALAPTREIDIGQYVDDDGIEITTKEIGDSVFVDVYKSTQELREYSAWDANLEGKWHHPDQASSPVSPEDAIQIIRDDLLADFDFASDKVVRQGTVRDGMCKYMLFPRCGELQHTGYFVAVRLDANTGRLRSIGFPKVICPTIPDSLLTQQEAANAAKLLWPGLATGGNLELLDDTPVLVRANTIGEDENAAIGYRAVWRFVYVADPATAQIRWIDAEFGTEVRIE